MALDLQTLLTSLRHMPNNRNTDNAVEHPGLDTEDWEIAFVPYSEDPRAALILGYNFMILKSYLVSDMTHEAIEGLDHAFEALFQHTEFHDVSYTLFVKLAGGKLTHEEEKMLKALGVQF